MGGALLGLLVKPPRLSQLQSHCHKTPSGLLKLTPIAWFKQD